MRDNFTIVIFLILFLTLFWDYDTLRKEAQFMSNSYYAKFILCFYARWTLQLAILSYFNVFSPSEGLVLHYFILIITSIMVEDYKPIRASILLFYDLPLSFFPLGLNIMAVFGMRFRSIRSICSFY